VHVEVSTDFSKLAWVTRAVATAKAEEKKAKKAMPTQAKAICCMDKRVNKRFEANGSKSHKENAEEMFQ
jgi:hypothetical protein